MNPNSAAKLPFLKIPEFSGSYHEWQRFMDTFTALAHDNVNLQNIEKFYYLQSSLKGEALKVLESLPISNVNYLRALQLLRERFENKKAIINAHLKDIFDLPVVSKESHVNLRKYVDTVLRNYRALEGIGESVDQWSTILIYVLLSKLDFSSKREWEQYSKGIDCPSFEQFSEFLKQRCQMLENLYSSSNASKSAPHTKSVFLNEELSNTKCPFCKGYHYLFQCSDFKRLAVDERFDSIKRLQLCINCLQKGHLAKRCQASHCRKCGGKHNTLLHKNNKKPGDSTSEANRSIPNRSHVRESDSSSKPVEQEASASPSSLTSVSLNHFYQKPENACVLLSTARVNVLDANNKTIQCRVLLDFGSQSNFISSCAVNKLRLKTQRVNVPISGINRVSTNIKNRVSINISSLYSNYTTTLSCLVIDRITDVTPQETFVVDEFFVPNVHLADPDFNVASPIDILIGCSTFYELMLQGQIKLGKNSLIFQNSRFGWIVSGSIPINIENSKCLLANELDGLNDNLERFWKIEEVGTDEIPLSSDELKCEQHFVKTVSRAADGRFVVKLPVREGDESSLGDSKLTALRRFYSLESRLLKSEPIRA